MIKKKPKSGGSSLNNNKIINKIYKSFFIYFFHCNQAQYLILFYFIYDIFFTCRNISFDSGRIENFTKIPCWFSRQCALRHRYPECYSNSGRNPVVAMCCEELDRDWWQPPTVEEVLSNSNTNPDSEVLHGANTKFVREGEGTDAQFVREPPSEGSQSPEREPLYSTENLSSAVGSIREPFNTYYAEAWRAHSTRRKLNRKIVSR